MREWSGSDRTRLLTISKARNGIARPGSTWSNGSSSSANRWRELPVVRVALLPVSTHCCSSQRTLRLARGLRGSANSRVTADTCSELSVSASDMTYTGEDRRLRALSHDEDRSGSERMAKGQVRSNKEARKPKKEKAKTN